MFVVDYMILPRLPGTANEKAQFSLLSESICRYLFPGLLKLFDKSIVPLKKSEIRRFFVDKQLFLIAKHKLFDFSSFACAFLLHDYRKWLRVWARAAAAAKDSSHSSGVPEMNCSVYENRLNCPPSFARFVVANEAEQPFRFKPCRFRLCPFCNFRLALRLFFRLNQANRVFGRASNWQLPLKAHLVHFDFDYWEKDKLRKFKRKLSLLQKKGKKVWYGSLGVAVNYRPYFHEDKKRSPSIRVSVLFLHARSFFVKRCIRYLSTYKGESLCEGVSGNRYRRVSRKSAVRIAGKFFDRGYYLFFNRLESWDLHKIFLEQGKRLSRRYTGILKRRPLEKAIKDYLTRSFSSDDKRTKNFKLKKLQLLSLERPSTDSDREAFLIPENAFDNPVGGSKSAVE